MNPYAVTIMCSIHAITGIDFQIIETFLKETDGVQTDWPRWFGAFWWLRPQCLPPRIKRRSYWRGSGKIKISLHRWKDKVSQNTDTIWNSYELNKILQILVNCDSNEK